MNSKTIKAILGKQFKEWVKSIDNPTVAALVKQNTIITGGSIASFLLGEEVKDYDVYFRNKETVLAVSEYYARKFNDAHPNRAQAYVIDGEKVQDVMTEKVDYDVAFPFFKGLGKRPRLSNTPPERVKIYVKSSGVTAESDVVLEGPFEDVFEVLPVDDLTPPKPKYRPVFLSPNAITLSDKIQLVIRFYGEPEDIHSNYDFIHCTNYWTSRDNKLVLNPLALESLMAKELKYMGSKYPICSMIRTRKFIKRGFHINAGQYLKMAFQISELDLQDLDVLEDQLVGVDSAYFNQLISALVSQKEKDPNFNIDGSYLADIIDKIF